MELLQGMENVESITFACSDPADLAKFWAATLDGERVDRALLDVTLVTSEAARISEFAIEFAYGTSTTFRADGVVVATPLGSDGYANAAGAPVVEPGGGLAVAPIAPFRTQTSSWVAASELTVTVEREEEPVTLVIDGTNHGVVEPNRPIAIETAGRVDPGRARKLVTAAREGEE